MKVKKLLYFGQNWEIYVAEKELYGFVMSELKEKCADIIARVPNGCGYGILRLLALSILSCRIFDRC